MQFPSKETLTVEFKSDTNPYSKEKLNYEIIGMANAEGGKLYLGIEDDGKVTGVNEQHTDVVSLVSYIRENSIPPVSVSASLESDDFSGKDVLVFSVELTGQLHSTRNGRYGTRVIQQDGKPSTKPLTPEEIVQRLAYIQVLDPSSQVVRDICSEEAFSSIEHERLRRLIGIYHGDRTLLGLSDEEIDLALGFSRRINGSLHPTIAGLLIVGKQEFLESYVPGHEVLFQVMDGTEVIMNPPAMHEPLLDLFEKVNNLFTARVVEQEIQIGLFRVPIPNYEPIAFREAFVNALVHRDYYRIGAVTVQIQPDVLQISSPGGFVQGVSINNILTVAPTPRNKLLVEATKRIGLSERTGRGIDKIYSAMLRNGHPFPDYSLSTCVNVTLRLMSAEKDLRFVQMLVEEQHRLNIEFKVDTLIVLSSLRDEHRVSLDQLASRMQKDTVDAKKVVEPLVESGIVEAVGNGRNREYIFSNDVYEISGNVHGYQRQRGLSLEDEIALVIAYLKEHNSISSNEASTLCKCDKNHSKYLLKKMVDRRILTKEGRSVAVRYKLN